MKIFIDQDFNHRILRGLIKLIPELDFVTAHQVGRSTKTDSQHILRATKEARLVLTHDVNTFPKHAFELIRNGNQISGVIIVPQKMLIGEAVEELELMIKGSSIEEYRNLIVYLPWLS